MCVFKNVVRWWYGVVRLFVVRCMYVLCLCVYTNSRGSEVLHLCMHGDVCADGGLCMG